MANSDHVTLYEVQNWTSFHFLQLNSDETCHQVVGHAEQILPPAASRPENFKLVANYLEI